MKPSTTAPAPDTTTLSVENFGPIARATLDLRPLTVFVGPSNTGKSYLAILIYALHKVFGTGAWADRLRALATDQVDGGNLAGSGTSRPESDEAREIMDAFMRTPREVVDTSWELSEGLAERVRLLLANCEGLGDVFNREVTRCFGVDRCSGLIRSRARKALVSLRVQPFHHEMSIAGDKARLASHIPEDATLSVDHATQRRRWGYPRAWGVAALADAVLPSTTGAINLPARYMPADRAGVMHAHRVVVGSLIRGAARGGIQADAPLPQMSGVLADFLEQIIELGDPAIQNRRNALAQRLEDEILRGAVRVVPSETGYPSFHYRPAGWGHDLPLMCASSMVSELAPVVLYLRHIVNPGELLIIEEPEAHLHPAMQVELVKLLAAAVQDGIRVLITTHSEWVLEALANVVRLSDVPKRKRKQLADADVTLTPRQVGAWLFSERKRPKGSVVEEVPLDLNSGTFPAGYGEIMGNLYNRWASISNLVTHLRSTAPAK